MNIGFVTMQRNEEELLEIFCKHYSTLTSPDRIFILDNGSDSATTSRLLADASRMGINVLYDYGSRDDFERKGDCVREVIENHGLRDRCDFIFPVDCDELLSLNTPAGFTLDARSIQEYLSTLADRGRGFRIEHCLNNIPLVRDRFNLAVQKKAFFSRISQIPYLDLGFHLFREDAELVKTELAYVHFHNRYFSDVLRSARSKLGSRIPNFEHATLAAHKAKSGRGWHLTKYFEMSSTAYYRTKRPSDHSVNIELGAYLARFGLEQPYVKPLESSEEDIFWLKNPTNEQQVPGELLQLTGSSGAKQRFLYFLFGGDAPGCVNGNTPFSEALGYGWVGNPPKHHRKRDVDHPVLGSFVLNFADLCFRSVLPKGTYRVALISFDIAFDNHFVSLAVGEASTPQRRTQKGRALRLCVEVNHEGGAMDIWIRSSEQNVVANALHIEQIADDTAQDRPLADPCAVFEEVGPLTMPSKWPAASEPTNLAVLARYISSSPPPFGAGVSEKQYLQAVQGIVEYYLPHQSTSGAIIDPYLKQEHQYATPSFAAAAAALAARSGASHLVEPAARAFEWASKCLAERRAASNHEDFYPYLLAKALIELNGLVDQERYASWIQRLQKINPYSTYRAPVGGSEQAGQNWNMIASAGEYMLSRLGVDHGADFIDNSLALQGRFFEPGTGLYMEGPVVYDIKPRVFWTDGLSAGYDGLYRHELEVALKNGLMSSLLLQSPSGELPPGGRSGHHTWGDALQCALFEIGASLYPADQDNAAMRGVLRGAAKLAFASVQRNIKACGNIRVVKNDYPAESRIGFETYTSESHYNLFAAAMLSVAARFSSDNGQVEAITPPALAGSYLLDARRALGRIVMAHAGSQVVVDIGKNHRQNPTGLLRAYIAHSGGAVGISDGLVHKAGFVQGDNTILASADVGWCSDEGETTYLAQVPSHGFAQVLLRDGGDHPDHRSACLSWRVKGQANTWIHQHIQVRRNRISVRYQLEGKGSLREVRVPILVSYGAQDLPWEFNERQVRVATPAGQYLVSLTGSDHARFPETRYSHRAGEARLLCGNANGQEALGFELSLA
ncbi:glycosyltransferase family 2 protein [Orrella sp. JC864]|uniref:glycosyltransferase family 2 protein n=1 Tax=Orrella sp. JC864 TaxID=3120298 RepID=UPI00300BA7AE